MLFTVKDLEVTDAVVSMSPNKTDKQYGFVVKYSTHSTPHTDRHMAIDRIPHPGYLSEEVQWVEEYALVPGARHGYFSVLGQESVSLTAFSVVLVSKSRFVNGVELGNYPIESARGLLTEQIGLDQSDAAVFAASAAGDKLTRGILTAFGVLDAKQFRALDAGLYLLTKTVDDEHFNPHTVTYNTTTVAMFTQFDTALKFRLADTLLVPYGLSVDTTNGVTYLDEAGNVVSPNFFSWL